MSIKTKINSLERQINNGEEISLVYLTELEEELQKSKSKNKDTLSKKLFLIRQHLYPIKTPTKWEIFLAELGLKENIRPVLDLAVDLEKLKDKTLKPEEINNLEKKYEIAFEYLNNSELFTEKEKNRAINEFQKKIKVFHKRLANEIDSEFGSYLKQERLSKNLSLKDLEDITGISSSHIHRIENNNRKPSIRVIEKLARALNIPNELFLEKMNLENIHMPKSKELLDIISSNQFLVNGKSLSYQENLLLQSHILSFINKK